MTTECVTLWIGERFGHVERACLRSVMRQGHRMALYCYRQPDGIPEGIELRDAAAILPEQSVFRHRSGSFAPFADWFRYELQRGGLGTWLDTDVYLLAPIDLERAYLFGEEAPGVINNAILRLPKHSPMLPDLLRPFEQRSAPRWMGRRAYIASQARRLAGGRSDPSNWPWGVTGPAAVTAVAARHNLQAQAMAPEVFYPVPWEKAGWILDPDVHLNQLVTSASVAIHLWNECIRSFKDAPAPDGSFLNRLHKEGA